MRIGDIPLGDGAPLVLIAGLNVIETENTTLEVACQLREIADAHGFPMVFKASFDKANRSSHRSERGPGLDAGVVTRYATLRLVSADFIGRLFHAEFAQCFFVNMHRLLALVAQATHETLRNDHQHRTGDKKWLDSHIYESVATVRQLKTI